MFSKSKVNGMNVTYTVHHPKHKKSILLTNISWEGNRLQISSGVSIEPKNWDKERGKIKRMEKNALQLNEYLENLSLEISKIYYEHKNMGRTISKDEFKQRVKEFINPLSRPKVKRERTFFEYFEDFIAERKPNYSERTIKHYVTTLNHLKNFKKRTGYPLSFENINDKFYSQFRNYMHNKGNAKNKSESRYNSKNCSNNTVASIIKHLKTFLHDCYKRKIIDNTDFVNHLVVGKKFGEIDTHKVALSENDLQKILEYEPPTPRLEKIKDLFLIQIYTAMRISDLHNLKPENFNMDDGIIYFYQNKTRRYIEIPIEPIKDILIKYSGFKLPKYQDPVYNRYIKELCKNAGLDSPIPIVTYYGKKRVEETFPKYQKISSHTARRTGITLLLVWGMLPEDVMYISGHTSRKSLDNYVKRSREEAKNRYKEIMRDKVL
jgi:integrase